MRWQVIAGLLALSVGTGAFARPDNNALKAGDRYVALGSSFAAGPGVTRSADTPPNRCTRSTDNYARQVSRRLSLVLVDVSCGGATTQHILTGWNELPPQIDAITANTRLVTITIGGNDVGYIGGLFASSCANVPDAALCKGFAARRGTATLPPEPDDAAWREVEARMDAIIAAIRQRAPDARIVFVDYLTLLPKGKLCGDTPLSKASAKLARAKADRLVAVTARSARRGGATMLRASKLSVRHHACAQSAWVNGFPIDGASAGMVGYHPNLAGMTAIADALLRIVQSVSSTAR
jgi:lysophospholipase L1-like esterase